MTDSEKYIIPTKESPVFTAVCDWFGYIEDSPYKDYFIEMNGATGGCVGRTFATRYADAITRLHEWIVENKQVLEDWPKCKFEIRAVDGSYDKWEQVQDKVVYTITASKARKYLI